MEEHNDVKSQNDPLTGKIRVGIDVGGTFTDAVAIDAETMRLAGQVKIPTTHSHPDGVAHGIVVALRKLLEETRRSASDVSFLAHGTTQATNALLEGDVATVGIIGIGTGVSSFFTKRLSNLSKIEIAGGKHLPVVYEHLRDDADDAALSKILDRLAAKHITSLVISEPFSVDDPIGEEKVARVARDRGFLVTGAHEIASLYGLSKRTRTAVLNAVILPRMLATAELVQSSIDAAGITAPLMVMRCDGGVMSLDEMRRRPMLTVLSGPAAGVAGALMEEKLSDGVFLETGGTSTDISVVRRGKVATRYADFGGSSTYLSALDVRTVGIGGGSMIRLANGRIVSVGPRSAHIADLPYACYATADQLADARLATVSPVEGDPGDYVVIDADGGRFALTVTCAANALGLIGECDYAHSDPDAARAAMQPLAAALGVDVEAAARQVLDAATDPVREVVEKMMSDYSMDSDTLVLVGGGGGAATITPYLGRRLNLNARVAGHAEVISPIGVALALIRDQVERVIPGASDEQILQVRREAEQAVIAQGAAADGVSVDVTVDPQTDLVRAIAQGSTELRTQDLSAHKSEDDLRSLAAESLHTDPKNVTVLAATDSHIVFGGPERKRFMRPTLHPIRVLDRDGVTRYSSSDAAVAQSTVGQGGDRLPSVISKATVYGDGGSRAPAVQLIVGPHIVDLSGVIDESQLVSLARNELDKASRNDSLISVMEVRS